jgi:hypothetical protein
MTVGCDCEKTVDAVRWAVVVLAVLTAWECVRAANAAVLTHRTLTAGRYLQPAGSLLAQATSPAGALDWANRFTDRHAPLIVGCLFTASMLALITRMLFASPLLDYLYLESPVRDKRTMVGFLLTVGGILTQMALLYAMALFAWPGKATHSGMVPILMTLYLAGGAAWMVLMRAGVRAEDAHALRGLNAALFVNLLAGLALAAGVWGLGRMAGNDPVEFHAGRLQNLSVTAVAALLVCALDTFFQGRLYGKRDQGSASRTVLMLLLLVALVAAGAYMAYKTGRFGQITVAI